MFARKYRYSFKGKIPGRVYQTPYFVMRFDDGSENLECAIVVGKKVDKRAVVRNRIKRMFVQLVKDSLPFDLRLRIVFYIRKQIINCERETLKMELEKAFKTTKII